MNDLTNGLYKSEGISGSSQLKEHLLQLSSFGELRIGEEGHGRNLVLERVVSRRFCDSNDLLIHAILVAAYSKSLANGPLARKVLLGEDLIDHGYRGCVEAIAVLDRAAGEDRNLHGLEERGTNSH